MSPVNGDWARFALCREGDLPCCCAGTEQTQAELLSCQQGRFRESSQPPALASPRPNAKALPPACSLPSAHRSGGRATTEHLIVLQCVCNTTAGHRPRPRNKIQKPLGPGAFSGYIREKAGRRPGAQEARKPARRVYGAWPPQTKILAWENQGKGKKGLVKNRKGNKMWGMPATVRLLARAWSGGSTEGAAWEPLPAFGTWRRGRSRQEPSKEPRAAERRSWGEYKRG